MPAPIVPSRQTAHRGDLTRHSRSLPAPQGHARGRALEWVTLTLRCAVSVRGLVLYPTVVCWGDGSARPPGHHRMAQPVCRRSRSGQGHRVVCLARAAPGAPGHGWSARTGPADALAALLPYQWDAVVDVARQPGPARGRRRSPAARAITSFRLHRRCIADPPRSVRTSPADPRPLAGDLMTGMDVYGAAKVACERHVLEAFGADRSLVARSGLIAGPDDHTGRSGYWPWRFAPEAVRTERCSCLTPRPCRPSSSTSATSPAGWSTPRSAAAPVLSTRSGMSSPAGTWRPPGASRGIPVPLVTVDSGWLAEQGVQEFVGPRSLPLWLDDPGWLGFTAHDGSRGRALGLAPRPNWRRPCGTPSTTRRTDRPTSPARPG